MEFFPNLDELNEIFENKFSEIQDYIVKNNKENFNQYLKNQDDIIEILQDGQVDNDLIELIEKKFKSQQESFDIEIYFWQKYCFKLGVFWYAKLNKQINDQINKDEINDI